MYTVILHDRRYFETHEAEKCNRKIVSYVPQFCFLSPTPLHPLILTPLFEPTRIVSNTQYFYSYVRAMYKMMIEERLELIPIAIEIGQRDRSRWWMISRVFAVMNHHATPLSETATAHVAHVRSLPGMGEFVHSEYTQLGVTSEAHLALIRFLAGVLSYVQLKDVLLTEFLAAMIARVPTLVRLAVTTKALLAAKVLFAYVAPELLRTFVLYTVRDAFVSDQMRVLGVGVVTVLAGVGLPSVLIRLASTAFEVHRTFLGYRVRFHGAVSTYLVLPEPPRMFVLVLAGRALQRCTVPFVKLVVLV